MYETIGIVFASFILVIIGAVIIYKFIKYIKNRKYNSGLAGEGTYHLNLKQPRGPTIGRSKYSPPDYIKSTFDDRKKMREANIRTSTTRGTRPNSTQTLSIPSSTIRNARWIDNNGDNKIRTAEEMIEIDKKKKIFDKYLTHPDIKYDDDDNIFVPMRTSGKIYNSDDDLNTIISNHTVDTISHSTRRCHRRCCRASGGASPFGIPLRVFLCRALYAGQPVHVKQHSATQHKMKTRPPHARPATRPTFSSQHADEDEAQQVSFWQPSSSHPKTTQSFHLFSTSVQKAPQ